MKIKTYPLHYTLDEWKEIKIAATNQGMTLKDYIKETVFDRARRENHEQYSNTNGGSVNNGNTNL